jgi:hypothetical protein
VWVGSDRTLRGETDADGALICIASPRQRQIFVIKSHAHIPHSLPSLSCFDNRSLVQPEPSRIFSQNCHRPDPTPDLPRFPILSARASIPPCVDPPLTDRFSPAVAQYFNCSFYSTSVSRSDGKQRCGLPLAMDPLRYGLRSDSRTCSALYRTRSTHGHTSKHHIISSLHTFPLGVIKPRTPEESIMVTYLGPYSPLLNVTVA